MASTSAAALLPISSSSFASSLCQNSHNVGFTGLKSSVNFFTKVQGKKLQCRAPRIGRTVAMAVTLPVLTFDGEKSGEMEMDLRSARPETAKAVVHRGVICELQNRRRGTASTLTRSEVRGGGRKPMKQKGSGRARQGSTRTPLKPGGGVVFGPKPKDWSIKINKKEKRLAISTALQSAAVSTVVVEDLDEKFTQPKTKDFLAALKRWGVKPQEHSLMFTMNVSEPLVLSSRNVGTFKLLTPRSLNLYDVLRADKLIFTKSAVEYLEQQYGESAVDFEFVIGEGEGEVGEPALAEASHEAVEPETASPDREGETEEPALEAASEEAVEPETAPPES